MTISSIVFILITIFAFGFLAYTLSRIARLFKITKKTNRLDRIPERIKITLLVALGQSKMMKKPVAGILHAIVWWGFLVVTIGALEMMVDGIFGLHRSFSFLGVLYNIITASGDVFAWLILIACVIFLSRRYITKPKRFIAPEMKPSSRADATFILSMIIVLMITLIGMNAASFSLDANGPGSFPLSKFVAVIYNGMDKKNIHFAEMANFWIHISLIYFFMNFLPFSKHFHVFMSVPNVFLTRLEPYAKLNAMESVTKEVKLMMNPDAIPEPAATENTEHIRFGVKDVEDVTWKNLFDAYTCTECGRCTDACPANITGKKLSPRKLFIDLRAKMKHESGFILNNLVNGKSGGATVSDNIEKTNLVGDYITEEELWACTTCMACIEECPVNIDHVPFILDMRRNLVMEESKMSPELAGMFSNIENNGAPWQFSPSDRLNWAEGLEIPTMADFHARGEMPEVLFWVGCSGSFDDRYKSVTRSFAKILKEAQIKFAVLGLEESCTGDPAKRAGNEFLAQMQAFTNINTLNNYGIKRIVTACPHCFNTLLNEYPDLGGHYEVIHHSSFLQKLLAEGKIKIADDNPLKDKEITFHDSCYLGRGNGIYEAPRDVLESFKAELKEMKKCKSKGMCCGAGGAQMFKEEEPGNKRVNVERTEQALETGATIIASACPFCMTMMEDGVKQKDKEEQVKVYDIAELLAQAKGI